MGESRESVTYQVTEVVKYLSGLSGVEISFSARRERLPDLPTVSKIRKKLPPVIFFKSSSCSSSVFE